MTETESARVYDLDGTLVRLAVDWQAAERGIREVLLSDGTVTVPEGANAWTMYDLAAENGHLEAVEARLSAYECEGAAEAVRLPAADDLAALDVPVGVCSLNCEAACRIALSVHDLEEYVDVVVGRDTVAGRKPDAEPLLAAVQGLAARPEETLFVGDSESDEVCAERAGTRFSYVDGGPREW